MTNYFVAASGNNANSGTSSGSPWADFTNVNTTVYAPGDTVSVNGGDTISGAINLTTANWPGQTWDPTRTQTTNATLSNGNLTLTSTSAGGSTQRAWSSMTFSSGLLYAEFALKGTGGNSGNDTVGVAIGAAANTVGTSLGGATGLAYFPDGGVFNNGSPITTIATFDTTAGFIMRVAVDLTHSKIWFAPGLAANWNNAAIGSQNPATNTGGITIPAGVLTGGIRFGTEVFLNATPDAVTARFQSTSWEGAPPSGFTAAAATQPSSSSPVTFGSYGTGQGTISSGALAGFTATSIAGYVVQNLILTGNATAVVDGILAANANAGNSKLDYIQLNNLTISNYAQNGININGTGPATAGFSNVTISGCTIHDNASANVTATGGIRVHSGNGYGLGATTPSHTNVTIIRCTAYNHPGHTGLSNWSGTGIIIEETGGSGLLDINGNACGGLIDLCEAYNNGTNSNGTVGIWTADAIGVVIQRCESHNNHTSSTGDGGGFDLDGGTVNCIVQYCYSHDNDGPGYEVYSYNDGQVTASSGSTVRYCISQGDGVGASNDAAAGIMIGNDAGASGQTNVNVYNNTTYTNTASTGSVALQGANVANITGHVANNVFYLGGSQKFVMFVQGAAGNPTGLIFTGNDYFGTFSLDWYVSSVVTYTSFASWVAAATAQEPSGQRIANPPTTDPLLINPGGGGTLHGYVPSNLGAYRYKPASTMLGAGLNLTSIYSLSVGSQDFYGQKIPTAFGTGFNVGAGDAPPSFRNLLGIGQSLVPIIYAEESLRRNNRMSRRRAISVIDWLREDKK